MQVCKRGKILRSRLVHLINNNINYYYNNWLYYFEDITSWLRLFRWRWNITALWLELVYILFDSSDILRAVTVIYAVHMFSDVICGKYIARTVSTPGSTAVYVVRTVSTHGSTAVYVAKTVWLLSQYFGLIATHGSGSTLVTLGSHDILVISEIGDCLWLVTTTQVNSALHPYNVAKSSSRCR